jgi:hypothetical protein
LIDAIRGGSAAAAAGKPSQPMVNARAPIAARKLSHFDADNGMKRG